MSTRFSTEGSRMVVERIPLSHYSRADLAEQGSSQRISAIPAGLADFRSELTSADVGSFAHRISAIPGGTSHYLPNNQLAGRSDGMGSLLGSQLSVGMPARRYNLAEYTAMQRLKSHKSNGSPNITSRVLGVYTADEYARLENERHGKVKLSTEWSNSAMTAVVEREREVPAHPTPSGSVVSSVTSRTTNSTNDSTGSKLSGDEAGSAAVRRQEGVGAGVMTADRTSSSSAYRDLDAVIEDIRKELELNKAEEVKTLIIKEQLESKRLSRRTLAEEAESNTATPPKLDDLGIKNASLLSQMRAATASVSNASTAIHSSSASTAAVDELNLSIEARSLTRASHDSLSARLSGQSISSSIGENPVSPPGHNKQPSAAASKQDFTSKLVLTPRGSIARAGDNSTMSFLAKSRAAAAASAAGAGAKADDEEEGVSMMQKTRKVSTRSAARAANSNGGSDDRVATTNAVSQQSSAERGVSVGAQGDQHGIRSSLHGMQSSLQGSSRDAMYKNSLNVDASRDLGSSRDLPPPVRPWQQLDSSPADKMSGGAHKTAYPNANTRAEVALPPGWEMKLDKPSGKIFYVNHSIRAISWDPPQHEPLDNKDRSPQKAHPTSSNSMYSKHPTNVAQQRDRQPSSRSVSAQYQPGISGVYASGTSPAPQLSASFDPNRGVRSARNSLGQNTNSDFLAGGLSPSRAPVLLDTTVKEAHVNSAPGRGNIKESPPRRAAARSAGAQSPMDACPVFGGDSAFSAGPNTGWNIGDSLDSSSRHYDAAPPYRPGMTPRQSVHASFAQRPQPPAANGGGGAVGGGGVGCGQARSQPLFDFSKSQKASATMGAHSNGGPSSQLRNSFDFSNLPEDFLGYRNDEGDDIKKIQRNTQMGAYSGLRKQAGNVPKSPKTDQVTTKLLVAASDKLWQYVLQASTPRIIAHPVEFEEAGTRPHALDHFDYDKFAKSLWEIKDEGDESPQRVPRDLKSQHVPLAPPAMKNEPELPQWQV